MPAQFDWNVRVYYEDTDAGGIVYHANYLKFFERARTEWFSHLNVSQYALQQEHDVLFVVKSLTSEYHAPAKLDDVIKLTLVIQKLGRASVAFQQLAWRGERLLNSAQVTVACVDPAMRLRAIPTDVAEKMRPYVISD